MPKKLKSKIRILFQKIQFRRKGVMIHNNTVFCNVSFKGSAVVEPYCRLMGDPLITFGDNFYANAHCHFYGEITFGDNVLIGPKTVIWTRDHGIEKGHLIRKQPHIKGSVQVGNDVWIGANVTILKNIRIGNGAVIAAGSIVTKDVPEFGIAAGNPAKVMKYRT